MQIFRHLGDCTAVGGTAVALGLFDGLHRGHQAVIRGAVAQAAADGLCACVFTFSTDRQAPAAKPATSRLLTDSLREHILAGMGVHSMVRPDFEEFRGMSPDEFVRDVLHRTLGARTLYCGENYRFGKRAAAGPDDLRRLGQALGIEVHALPMVDLEGAPISSTRIRQSIAAGEMEAAAAMLGRPFAIDFEVIHGRRLGRTLDSPTINQALPHDFVAPRFGVYATITTVDGVRRSSVTNVGIKPTVGSDALLSETYIHGFRGNLYGRRILVEFLQFVRPERKFSTVEELKTQIQLDSEAAARIAKQYSL